MHDGVDALLPERLGEQRAVEHVRFDEPRRRNDGVAMAPGEVVVDDHAVTGGDELLADDAADVPGATGDENLHGWLNLTPAVAPDMREDEQAEGRAGAALKSGGEGGRSA